MAEILMEISNIVCEGAGSKKTLAFQFQDPDRVALGKPMREYLPFVMAWWHNLCNTGKDIFGMDTFALGLLKAAAIVEDGRVDVFRNDRYASYTAGICSRIASGEATLAECAAKTTEMKQSALPGSGRQEYFESIANGILFG